jgi:hypothetical protein
VGKDCEIRAENFTEMAIDAIFLFSDFREIIAFDIKGLGHSKHIPRTVLNTELASLAPLFDYGYLSLGDLNRIQVKGNAPEFHMEIPRFSQVSCALNLTGNP